MIDLGQTFFEQRRHFFDQLSVHQIIINPNVKGYPPIFMLCKEVRGSKPCEYVLGSSYRQVNQLLMKKTDNNSRLLIAEKLAMAIIEHKKTETISMPELLGKPLELNAVDATTRLRKFASEPDCDKPLYFFQLTEM
jgi:hypothetical protein